MAPRFLEHAGVNVVHLQSLTDGLLRKGPAVHGYEGSLRLGTGWQGYFPRLKKRHGK
ncbi:hypothetical protein N752_20250 [Desulforamulus aquiferis]|nr:hypothetical protein N752_20250 [Desulforamulus aquiferis]